MFDWQTNHYFLHYEFWQDGHCVTSFISKGVFIVNYKEARNKYSINYMLKVLTVQWEKQKHVKLVNKKINMWWLKVGEGDSQTKTHDLQNPSWSSCIFHCPLSLCWLNPYSLTCFVAFPITIALHPALEPWHREHLLLLLTNHLFPPLSGNSFLYNKNTET